MTTHIANGPGGLLNRVEKVNLGTGLIYSITVGEPRSLRILSAIATGYMPTLVVSSQESFIDPNTGLGTVFTNYIAKAPSGITVHTFTGSVTTSRVEEGGDLVTTVENMVPGMGVGGGVPGGGSGPGGLWWTTSYAIRFNGALQIVLSGPTFNVLSPSFESLVGGPDGPRLTVYLADLTILGYLSTYPTPYYLQSDWAGGTWIQTLTQQSTTDILFGPQITFSVPADVAAPAGDWNQDSWFAPPTISSFRVVGTNVGTAILAGVFAYIIDGTVYAERTNGDVTQSVSVATGQFLVPKSGLASSDGSGNLVVRVFGPVSFSVTYWLSSSSGTRYSNPSSYYSGTIGGAFASAWSAARNAARIRHRAELKKISDEWLATMKVAPISIDVEGQVKKYHPRSHRVTRPVPMEILENTLTQSTIGQVTTFTARVSLRYVVQEGETTRTVSQVIEGTAVRTTTYHNYRLPAGSTQDTGTTYSESFTYTNFPVLTSSYGDADFNDIDATDSFSSVSHQYRPRLLLDVSTDRIMQVLNGTYVDGLAGPGALPGTEGYLMLTTSSPPYPARQNSVTMTIPDIVMQYHTEIPMVGGKVDADDWPSFTSSSLLDGETITVVPLSAMVGAEERGVFCDYRDVGSITHAKLYGRAKYRYAKSTGLLSFVDWKSFVDSDGDPAPVVIPCSGSNFAAGHLVCISSQVKWSDLVLAGREQKADMAKPLPESPISPLYAAVVAALAAGGIG